MIDLLVFAHPPEAAAFVNHYKLHPHDQFFLPESVRLLVSEELMILITGEGPNLANRTLSTVLGAYSKKISRIINFGVAASLSNQLPIGTIQKIKTSYSSQENTMEYHSFFLDKNESSDCCTVNQRILGPEKLKHLKCFASIIDRELWGLAFAAQPFSLKVDSYKIISDLPLEDGQQNICSVVKEDAHFYSEKLLAKYIEIPASPKITSPSANIKIPYGCYATASMKRSFHTLLKSAPSDWEEQIQAQNIIENAQTKKTAMSQIIKALSVLNCPELAKMEQKLERILLPLKRLGLRASIDSSFEVEEIKITTQIRNQDDINRLKKGLDSLDGKSIENLFQGHWDV